MFKRTMDVLFFGYILRSITFLSTSLPGPAPHCRPEYEDYSAPETAEEALRIKVDGHSTCGDLIFSGHMLYVIICGLVVAHYTPLLVSKRIARVLSLFMWMLVAVQGLTIIAMRKHYSVDVVVACYVVPMLWHTVGFWLNPDDRELSDDRERSPRDEQFTELYSAKSHLPTVGTRSPTKNDQQISKNLHSSMLSWLLYVSKARDFVLRFLKRT